MRASTSSKQQQQQYFFFPARQSTDPSETAGSYFFPILLLLSLPLAVASMQSFLKEMNIMVMINVSGVNSGIDKTICQQKLKVQSVVLLGRLRQHRAGWARSEKKGEGRRGKVCLKCS